MGQPASTSTATEVLGGLVERVTFHNEENGFCVLRVKARGQRDLITVLGPAAVISDGEFVQASGAWQNDRTHGVQFRASFLKATPPTTTEGIEKYLGSGMIRGIGPVYAKKLVRAFAEAVFEIIEQEPNRLREVTGIGPMRAARIIAGWAEQKVIREIMLFLHSNGVGTSRAVRIYKTYGADAVQLISENPYRLARDIRGIGFRTADQIAAKLGIEKTALIRVRAGISFALAEAMDDGHCGLPADEMILLAQKLLDVPPDLVETALVLELQDGTVVADDLDGRRSIFLGALYRAEREIAEKLKALAGKTPPWPSIEADGAIPGWRRAPSWGSPRAKSWPCARHWSPTFWSSPAVLAVTNNKIGAIQVRQKQDGSWKLLARASYRLRCPGSRPNLVRPRTQVSTRVASIRSTPRGTGLSLTQRWREMDSNC
jgi:exodeoxyribonuclease V alpha subunit